MIGGERERERKIIRCELFWSKGGVSLYALAPVSSFFFFFLGLLHSDTSSGSSSRSGSGSGSSSGSSSSSSGRSSSSGSSSGSRALPADLLELANPLQQLPPRDVRPEPDAAEQGQLEPRELRGRHPADARDDLGAAHAVVRELGRHGDAGEQQPVRGVGGRGAARVRGSQPVEQLERVRERERRGPQVRGEALGVRAQRERRRGGAVEGGQVAAGAGVGGRGTGQGVGGGVAEAGAAGRGVRRGRGRGRGAAAPPRLLAADAAACACA